jgi:HEPN domain-containing protein
MEEYFDVGKYVTYYVTSADDDYQAMNDMFATRHYHWALFMGHLVVEKLFKAFYVQEKAELPPLIHDLRRIGEKAGLAFDSEKTVMVDTITRFNIRARYDSYKQEFYLLCTKEFTTEWMNNITTIQQWIKTALLK